MTGIKLLIIQMWIHIIITIISCQHVDINFITDFLNIEFHTKIVTFYLCWSKDDIFKLALKIQKHNYRILNYNTFHHEILLFKAEDTIFITDVDCDHAHELLLSSNEQLLFSNPKKWLLISRRKSLDAYKPLFTNLTNLLIDSNVYFAEKLNFTQYSISEVFRYHVNGDIIVRHLTKWIVPVGFNNYYKGTIFSRIRQNMMGTTMKSAVVIVNNDTYHHLWDYRYKQIDGISKFNFILVNALLDFVNCTKDFIYVDSWGYKHPTDKWYDGMIGLIQKGTVELAGTPLLISADRLEVIDFLSLTTPTEFKFLFRQPPLSYVQNIFTLPFETIVWISIFLLVSLATLILYVVILWERKHRHSFTDCERDLTNGDDSFSDVVMLAIGAVTQQGSIYEPRSISGRIIAAFVFVALMFFYVSYSAYIVVLLQSSSTQIQTLQDLLNSKLEIGLHEIVYNHFYFESAVEPIRKAIYEKKVVPKGSKAFMSLEEGVSRLRKGFFAFHAEMSPVYTIIGNTFLEREKCGLQRLQYFQAAQIWLPIKKNSSYKEILKIGLQKMHEYGIQSRELQMLYEKTSKCLSAGGSFVSVGLLEAGPAFLFFFVGTALSFLIFIFEIFAQHFKS